MESSLPRPRPRPAKRKLQKVPFVELHDGRLQGVVSSSSDPARVYVSFIERGTGNFACSTNNNRPCGGGSGACGHLTALVEAAIQQLGAERVARGLGCADLAITSIHDVSRQLGGSRAARDPGHVFARFLDYLRYTALPGSTEPMPELAWFVTG